MNQKLFYNLSSYINLDDKDKYLLLNSYNIETVKYFEEKNIKKAIDSTNNYLILSKELKNIDKIYHTYCNLAILFNNYGNYDRALHYALKQIEIAKRGKSEPKLIESCGNLGNICNMQKDFKKARVFYKRELILAKKIGAAPRTLQALIGIVDCDLQRKKFKDIEHYCIELIKTAKEKNSCNKQLGVGYYFLGKIYFLKSKKNKQKKVIIDNLKKAKDIFIKLDITDRLAKLYIFLNENDIIL